MPPGRDQLLGMAHAGEDVLVETLFTQAPVEALRKSMFDGLARANAGDLLAAQRSVCLSGCRQSAACTYDGQLADAAAGLESVSDEALRL